MTKRVFNWSKPATTRAGSEVKLYELFYNRYANGAYYESSEDVWYPCQWNFDGMYGDKPTAVDLINVIEYPTSEEE